MRGNGVGAIVLVRMQSPQDEQTTKSFWYRIAAAAVLLCGFVIGSFVWHNATAANASFPFQLGLDLAGGSHLLYEADTRDVAPQEVDELMGVLRDVIERRVNVFGVSEPLVQVEESSFVAGEPTQRLVVELPGVTDIDEAVAAIGATPLLEFKLINEPALLQERAVKSVEATTADGAEVAAQEVATTTATGTPYLDTGLTGRYLESARLEFSGQSGANGAVPNEPVVSVQFNQEGAALFEELTRENVGERLAIFLDGEEISAPRINEVIPGGTAVISGGFTVDEARALAENLNFGALPIPIELVSTQTIGATLGAELLEQGVWAGVVGLALVMCFMVGWYRLPGAVAVAALLLYVAVMLAIFQLIPVTLTAAGLAGFILSIGIAVDANVLVFERMKEEYRAGAPSDLAAKRGFARAWGAIRDGNITSLLSAVILFWFGTSLVKGFALVFGIGIIVSMLSAILVTRTLLLALPVRRQEEAQGWLYHFGRADT